MFSQLEVHLFTTMPWMVLKYDCYKCRKQILIVIFPPGIYDRIALQIEM